MELLLWLLLIFGIPMVIHAVLRFHNHTKLDLSLADAVIDEFIATDALMILLRLEDNFSRLDLKKVEWTILSIKVAHGG